MEQSTINQRLKFLVENLAKTAKDFSAAINESPTNTSNYTGKRQTEPRAEYLAKVLYHFGNVNARWLMTGEGEAFMSEAPVMIQTSKKNSGNIIGTNNGTATVHSLADCEKDLKAAQREIGLLNNQLEVQTKYIKLLEAQQPK